MKKVIMAHNFRLLCIQGGRMVQKKIEEIEDANDVVCIKDTGKGAYFTTVGGDKITNSGLPLIDRAIPSFGVSIIHHGDDLCSIRIKDNFMRANLDVDIDFMATQIDSWETFLFINVDRFFDLYFVCNKNWVSCSSDQNVFVDLDESNIRNVKFGKFYIKTNIFIEAIVGVSKKLNFILNESWKIHKFFLFKPAIVFVVFGRGKTLDQFKICIESLENPGDYTDSIFIITNINNEELISCVPKRFLSKIKIIQMYAEDQLDFVGARLSIFSTNYLDKFQPILYSDVDVVFDKNIDGFLRLSAMADKCSAQIEKFHFHKQSSHVGGSLFQEDKYDLEDVNGFNGGILMVPNMYYHKENLQACYVSLCNYISNYGRDSVPFYDQSILNYVLYKMNDFSPFPVTPATQVGGSEHQSVRDMFELNPYNPKGFVHFWNTADRIKEMTSYLEKIRNNKQEEI
ncbi:glycosyltransferase [Acetobacter senegalensis]|uniref:glycosyltransferase n=1 Tax=Acetobacter senegalensis TaxID=446692 RepID=UPI001EDA58D0|nr:glycosyltransferase [Acetobacter senegalensis]MCG4252941.1 glycosyltransferase [Acetobacter senegalensis]